MVLRDLQEPIVPRLRKSMFTNLKGGFQKDRVIHSNMAAAHPKRIVTSAACTAGGGLPT
jgi:hypothetical protein